MLAVDGPGDGPVLYSPAWSPRMRLLVPGVGPDPAPRVPTGAGCPVRPLGADRFPPAPVPSETRGFAGRPRVEVAAGSHCRQRLPVSRRVHAPRRRAMPVLGGPGGPWELGRGCPLSLTC